MRLRPLATQRLLNVQRTGKNDTIVVSALSARTGFGKLLRRVEDEHRSLVIEKRGTQSRAAQHPRLCAPCRPGAGSA